MASITRLLMNLPIVRLMRQHREQTTEAESDKAAILERQHDVARRVHVLEWMTYSHTDKRNHPHEP